MEHAEAVANSSMVVIISATERLRKEKTPLPHGVAQKYRAYIPARTPDEILEQETSAHWFGYAEALREFIALIDSIEVHPFIDKKRKKEK